MQAWEYCVLTEEFDLGFHTTSVRLLGTDQTLDLDMEQGEETLAELGRRGWELVSVTETELRDPPSDYTRDERTNMLYNRRTFYLKRPTA